MTNTRNLAVAFSATLLLFCSGAYAQTSPGEMETSSATGSSMEGVSSGEFSLSSMEGMSSGELSLSSMEGMSSGEFSLSSMEGMSS
ncbi:MAG TPA: hypothetical protein VLM37_01980, partial [Fibrobacteraceae bacterium]|nr:hypothetical protein [Fibrobacteraceae bacterium]